MKAEQLFGQRIGSAWRPIDRFQESKFLLLPERQLMASKFHMPRRPRNHAHYFAVISAATDHWPDKVEPYPAGNAERLRSWLTCKAGFSTYIDFPVEAAGAVVDLIEKFRTDHNKHCFVRPGTVGGADTLRVFMPRSIAFDEIDEIEFAELKRRVFDVITNILGVSPDDLVRGTQEAA